MGDLGNKAVCGSGVNHPHLSSAEIKERVEIYLYSSLGLHGLFQGEIYIY
jgi:hypothetical protein